MNKLPYLNLGCGSTYHKGWVNIDFVSNSKDVITHNLLLGIPENDESFEVVYHSHVLEHFPKTKAADFIKECYRVLKPNGIIRVAIPNFETIALNYIKYLNESLNEIPGADEKYNWTMLELIDQMVRNTPGGAMIEYIQDTTKNNDAFLLKRNGNEVKEIMDSLRNENGNLPQRSFPLTERLKNIPISIKNKMIQLFLGKEYAAYKLGNFRMKGEIHQWMYDRYSLKKLLENAGFKDAQVKSGFESSITNWESFKLDGSNGIVRKPDSLFMEARK